jgi:PAS domain S-box-containing protein
LTNGKFINFNDAMCEYTGYSRDDFLHITSWDLLTQKSKEKQLIRYDKILKREPVPPEFEFEFVHKNGNIIPILAYTEIEYKNDKPHRAHVIAQDITDRKKMESELNKAQKLESLGLLAGGIGHDFNNLLSGIMGNISLAKLEAERGEDIMESLDEALRVASKASALTQQLLVFSKGGAPVKKAASITEVLYDTTAFTLRGSNVKCGFEISEDLWPVQVDLGQFSQVIHNLVLNALQAMSGGGEIRLEAKNVNMQRIIDLPLIPGRYVVIKVQDQGEGIPEEYLPKIFDLYFTTKSKGNGLGLSMSYTIIYRHDGHITVDSKVGEGTTFTIYLPATEEAPELDPIKETQLVPGEGRVLVMDDEEILRKVAQKMLLELGYEVECVRDGTEALESYQKAKQFGQRFDAVIMDLTIPGGMGGKKAVKKLLKIDPDAVAIVSSGYSNDPIMSDYQKYGFRGVVTKPYQIKELSWVMRDVLKANHS